MNNESNNESKNDSICIAAILRDELPFVDEWLVYHRLLGVDHFYLYDDDPSLQLIKFLEPHAAYATVIPWHERHHAIPGRNRQTKAYTHAVEHFGRAYKWIAFVDVDEFLVFRKHGNIKQFLSEFDDHAAVSLTWHVFGHNGLFSDPTGLVTTALTRRMSRPGRMEKSISRTSAIASIDSAHFCRLKPGCVRVDANRQPYQSGDYPSKTAVAHVNHYHCRSFSRWMNRTRLGVVAFDELTSLPEEHRWRVDERECLRRFVEVVAREHNELHDEHMLAFADSLSAAISALARSL